MRGRTRLRGGILAAIALVAMAMAAPTARGDFHFMSIREVYSGGGANSSYVVLQMYEPGQGNLAPSHHIDVYGPTGNAITIFTFSSDVTNVQDQATVLVADTGYLAAFPSGPAPDAEHAGLDIPAGGGAVCFDAPDCVSWGAFSGSLPSPAGSPVTPSGIPVGMALRRTIAPGCPTLLEASDDSDNSAANFSAVFPNPRPNSVVPSERACGSSQGPAQGGGGNEPGPPQTRLKGKPRKVGHDRTPTFRFSSSEAGSTFQCKVDRKPFRSCRSPFTTRRLSFGKHVFRVRARDAGGKVDPSPAFFRFEVVKRR